MKEAPEGKNLRISFSTIHATPVRLARTTIMPAVNNMPARRLCVCQAENTTGKRIIKKMTIILLFENFRLLSKSARNTVRGGTNLTLINGRIENNIETMVPTKIPITNELQDREKL